MTESKFDINWTVIHTITNGNVLVEISSAEGYQKRYSYRITWINGERRGPWFPDASLPFAADISKSCEEAETWILDKRASELAEREERLAKTREIELAKRKRHESNVERRKEENRRNTNQNKSKRG